MAEVAIACVGTVVVFCALIYAEVIRDAWRRRR